MMKCFMTGIDITLEKAYVLDLYVAYRALGEMRQKVATLERLISQLGGYDEVKVRDRKGEGLFTRRDRRLVCLSVAEALSATCPERRLFITWAEWRAKRAARRIKLVEDTCSCEEEAEDQIGQTDCVEDA